MGLERPPSSFFGRLTEALNLVWVLVAPGAQMTWPREIASRSTPRHRTPTVYPAGPSSSSVLNILMLVTTVLRGFFPRPSTSTASPFFTLLHAASGDGAAARDREDTLHCKEEG